MSIARTAAVVLKEFVYARQDTPVPFVRMHLLLTRAQMSFARMAAHVTMVAVPAQQDLKGPIVKQLQQLNSLDLIMLQSNVRNQVALVLMWL